MFLSVLIKVAYRARDYNFIKTSDFVDIISIKYKTYSKV